MENALSIDGDYQASQQRSASLQRLFFPVQPGQGNYTYLGDLNNNGKQDEEEFQLARYSDQGTYILLTIPSETLTPTVDLRTSLRLRLTPSRLAISNPLHIFSPISLESFFRFEENSTDPTTADIYLLKLSTFLNDSLTIRGIKEYQQDIYLFENDPSSYRLRWHERTGASHYTTGIERNYHRDVSVLARIRLGEEWMSEQTVSYDQDIIASNDLSTNRPQDSKRYKITSNISFEPFSSPFGFGLLLTLAKSTDPIYLETTGATVDALTLSSRYNVTTQLRLRFEVGRNEFAAHTLPSVFLPYGLTDGLQPGVTWNWSLGGDQEISRGVLLNLKYEGRSEPGINGSDRHITHVGRAEVRAAF